MPSLWLIRCRDAVPVFLSLIHPHDPPRTASPHHTAYAYNTFGDLVGVDYSDSATPDVSYVYNRDGRRQQVTDGSGVRTISYDALGQVTTESYTSGPLAGLSLSRGTDALLRKTSLTLEKGGTTLWSQGFGYGDASRLASVTMGDDAVQYGYVPNSPLVGSMAFTHSGSTVMTTTKQYDAVNRLTQTSSAVGSTVVSSHQNSSINALDQRKRTDLADGKNWRYEYNSRGELTRGVLYGTNNQAISGMDFRYTYDNSGNRLTRSQGSSILTTYTSNLVNQYTTIAEGVTATPSYDADGNMTSSGSAYDDRILEYDGENRLTTVRRASDQAVVATYTYDDQGRRVRVQTTSAAPQGAGDVVNVWDGWNLVGELDYTSATGAHQPRRTYAWGLDLSGSEQGSGGIGGLVIQRDATSSDAYFPAYDPNGNLMTLVKSSDGTVGASYSYDPYGNVLSSTGAYAATNRFRFSTKYYCPETELYYYGYRFCNPVQGRWVNRDPIEEQGGLNLYGFARNCPVTLLDALGLQHKNGSFVWPKWVPHSKIDNPGPSDWMLLAVAKGQRPIGGTFLGLYPELANKHYLDNTGSDFYIPYGRTISEERRLKAEIYEDLIKLIDFVDGQSPAAEVRDVSSSAEGGSQTFTLQWLNTVGYSIWAANGFYANTKHNGSISLYVWYETEDAYDFAYTNAYTGLLTDAQMRRLSDVGFAREFLIKGRSGAIELEWCRGKWRKPRIDEIDFEFGSKINITK